MRTEQTQSAHNNSRRSILFEFLGSMELAITILVIVVIASVIGTVLHQNQSYPTYISRYGPFWHEYFRLMHVYDVYHSLWYLCLLASMVISASVCLYSRAQWILREMRQYREIGQLKSLLNTAGYVLLGVSAVLGLLLWWQLARHAFLHNDKGRQAEPGVAVSVQTSQDNGVRAGQ